MILVPLHRDTEFQRECTIRRNPFIELADAACRFEPRDAQRRERTGQPVSRGKRRAIVENWGNTDDYRKSKVTAGLNYNL
jgi:hypothetical protein